VRKEVFWEHKSVPLACRKPESQGRGKQADIYRVAFFSWG
jgi:hypothetical protein